MERTRRGERIGDVGALLLIVFTVGFCALHPIYNIDIWWHISIGRWILDSGALPTTDLWSAGDTTTPFRSFQWLFQVVAAWIDGRGGLEAVRITYVAWVSATFALVYVMARGLGFGRLASLGICALLLIGFQYRLRVRPHIFNLMAFSLVVFGVLRHRAPRRWHGLLVGPLFFVWAAVHNGGAFLAVLALGGLGICLALLSWWRGRQPTDINYLLIIVSAIIGWLVCPGSVESLSFVAGQLGGTRSTILEWLSWWEAVGRIGATPPAWYDILVYGILPASCLFWCAMVLRWVSLIRGGSSHPSVERPLALIVAFPLLALTFIWSRLTYLSVLALVCSMVFYRRTSSEVEKKQRNPGLLRSLGLAALVALGLGASWTYNTVSLHHSVPDAFERRTQTVREDKFPIPLTDLLVESGIEARIATPAPWGGYVLYRGWPRLRVTLDGRLVASEEVREITWMILGEIYQTGSRIDLLPELFSMLPADFLLFPSPTFMGAEDTGEWLPVMRSDLAELWVRSSPEANEWVRRLWEAHERLGR